MATSPCLTPTNSITPSVTAGGSFKADVNLSGRQANGATIRSDGLFVQTPTVDSSFPASPDDNDVLITSPFTGVKWQFQWAQSAGVSDKWLFIGGAPVYGYRETTATLNTVAGTWYDLASVDQAQPAVAIPYPGVYQADWGALIATTGASGETITVGLSIADDTPIAARQTSIKMGSTTVWTGPLAKSQQVTVGTGQTVKLKYSTSAGGTVIVAQRWLKLVPIRVSAP